MTPFWRNFSPWPAIFLGKITPRQSGFALRGSIDMRTGTCLYGWVWDAARPDKRVDVVARTKNEILTVGAADLYRADLEKASIGDGRHAFELRFAPREVGEVFVETVDARRIIPVAAKVIDVPTPIHCGDDGWLFLRTGRNYVEKFFSERDYFGAEETDMWVDVLRTRKRVLHENGIEYFHCIAPDKITVYSDRYGSYLPYYNRRPSLVLPSALEREGCEDIMIDLSGPLAAERDHALLYWKTDTHWTFRGAAIAAREICNALGVTQPDFFDGSFYEYCGTLDLGSKSDPQIEELCSFFNFREPAELVYANDLVVQAASQPMSQRAGLLQGSHVIYRRHNAPNSETIALFGDSYCEVAPYLLTGLLAQTFREVHFIWSNSIDYSYIFEIKPDIVLSEGAERFVKRIPDDRRDLRAFAAERHAAFLARRVSGES